MSVPNQIAKLDFSGLDPVFNQHYSSLIDRVNSLLGYSGPIKVANHIDLGGNRITNVGAPVEVTDALSSGEAAKNYSAPVLKEQLKPGSANAMAGYRILNHNGQREQSSSFLNDVPSSVPNANQIIPLLTNGVSSVTVSIPASVFTFADGSTIQLSGRTDILSFPAQYTITSISAVNNLVTVDCSASGLVAGLIATIVGVSPIQFNGPFQIVSSASGGAVLEYQAPIGTVIGSGGYVQVNGCYYYAIKKRQNYVSLLGPYLSDTAKNRLNASADGFQIVAVVVVTASGGQVAQSGGGGSPIVGSPASGAFF